MVRGTEGYPRSPQAGVLLRDLIWVAIVFKEFMGLVKGFIF